NIVRQLFLGFASVHDEGPAGSLLVAIRAARRALQANPDDARAHLHLGEAYLRLRRGTRERATLATFGALEHLRRLQALTALQHAVQLQPDLVTAHERLADFYAEIRAFDLAGE